MPFPLSFALHQGEELCIFDQQGAGIEEIRALLSGDRRADAERILIDGERYKARNVWQALDQRVAFVVENPADAMLFPDFTALENLCYPASRKTADFWINPDYLASCLREYGHYFDPEVLEVSVPAPGKRHPQADLLPLASLQPAPGGVRQTLQFG